MSFSPPSASTALDGLNPMTPGGMNAKGVHLPTMGWVILILVAAFLVYHFWLRKR